MAYNADSRNGWGWRKIKRKHDTQLYRFMGIGGCDSLNCIIDVVISRCISNPLAPEVNPTNNTWKVTKWLDFTDLAGGTHTEKCTLISGDDNRNVLTLY